MGKCKLSTEFGIRWKEIIEIILRIIIKLFENLQQPEVRRRITSKYVVT